MIQRNVTDGWKRRHPRSMEASSTTQGNISLPGRGDIGTRQGRYSDDPRKILGRPTAATITTRRVLFQPETERVVVGQEKGADGTVKQKYVVVKTLLKDVVFEETHNNAMNTEDDTTGGTIEQTGGGSTGGSTDDDDAPGAGGGNG